MMKECCIHCTSSDSPSHNLLCSLKDPQVYWDPSFFVSRGIFFVTKGTFGQLTCEWQYLFEEFTKDPMIVENRRLRIEAKVQTISDSLDL